MYIKLKILIFVPPPPSLCSIFSPDEMYYKEGVCAQGENLSAFFPHSTHDFLQYCTIQETRAFKGTCYKPKKALYWRWKPYNFFLVTSHLKSNRKEISTIGGKIFIFSPFFVPFPPSFISIPLRRCTGCIKDQLQIFPSSDYLHTLIIISYKIERKILAIWKSSKWPDHYFWVLIWLMDINCIVTIKLIPDF